MALWSLLRENEESICRLSCSHLKIALWSLLRENEESVVGLKCLHFKKALDVVKGE